MMKKENVIFDNMRFDSIKDSCLKNVFLFFLLVIFILPLTSASLGISPSRQSVDFKPGLELEYTFDVFGESGQKIEIYSAGEFFELVEFDKKELIGRGTFNIKIKLPNKIEKPGEHWLLIGAREKIETEEGKVGTRIAIQTPIVIIVPYPGKYAEITLSTSDVNVGEPVNFKVGVSSKGKEPITATTILEIYSVNKKIATFDLGTKTINNQENDVFEKTINSSDYGPGYFEAVTIVDYKERIAKADVKFRIGHLFVNIINYTTEIIKKDIQPFEISVVSSWNLPIKNVHGEVYILKDKKNITDFLTPSFNLDPWETKTLKGYVDTDKLEISDYNTRVEVKYEENSSVAEGKLKIKKELIYLMYYIISGIIILVLIIIIIYLEFRRPFKLKRFRKSFSKKQK